MMLLRFVAQNHKSLRGRIELDLRRPSLQTLRPRPGESWRAHVYPAAGIFGSNASGKSTVIDALHYVFSAISYSATSWQARTHAQHAPFLLDAGSRHTPSTYELDFVLAGTRYEYGFSMGPEGVTRESLRDLSGARWRTLLERTGTSLRTHRSIKSLGPVTQRELALSRAVLLRHPQLAAIGRGLAEHFDIAPLGDIHRERRLRGITESLADGVLDFNDIVTLLQIADIGVERVAMREETPPREAMEVVRKIRHLLETGLRPHTDGEESAATDQEISPDISDAVIRNLEFTHRGDSMQHPPFSINDESAGTIAWLALAVPALDALRNGGLFCVDEIDASLHSHLVETLIGFFTNADINRSGAQLVFTSHDTYLLSPLSDIDLEPEQVWFTEKGSDGATELVCLAEYPRHKDANVAKRYLAGRYGAVPRVAPSVIHRILDRHPEVEYEASV